MKYKKYKNLIGLCAVSGCRHFANTALEISVPGKSRKKIIYTCLDCSFEICVFNNKNNI